MKKDSVANSNQNESRKRLFIAIGIPEDIKKEIWNYAADILGKDEHIRLVPDSNIHVTLKFLGDTDIRKIDKIKKAIEETSCGFDKFTYEISKKMNAFPKPENARVIFLEINKGGDIVSEIYDRLEDNMSRIGIDREKRDFFPHITIARVKIYRNLRQLVDKSNGVFSKELECSEITLFESRLKPYGAEYIVAGSYGLK